jgi:hypothetical protein
MRHPSSLALLLLAGTALHSASAHAGGIGLLGTGGFHQARVYYYDADETQYLNRQNKFNSGLGIEAVLGDKDDRFLGVARGYYMRDTPPTGPDNPLVEEPIFAVPDGPTHIGAATVGVQWGVIGDPTGFQAHIATHLGAGMVTVDNSSGADNLEGSNQEFLIGEAGIGAHYHFARSLQIVADVTYTMRYRKVFYPGGNVYLGFRYMFD